MSEPLGYVSSSYAKDVFHPPFSIAESEDEDPPDPLHKGRDSSDVDSPWQKALSELGYISGVTPCTEKRNY
jgi:hypothetical protein